MKLILIYASTQGQTARIMHHVAERLQARGHETTLVMAGTPEETGLTGGDLAKFDAAILGASVHAGRYQIELRQAAHRHAASIAAMPCLFLSVSLTAAGDDPAERAELDRLAEGFIADTGWHGARITHVAGALKFTEYSFFEYWAMRWIARQRDLKVSGRTDVELTDWQGLDAAVEGFIAAATVRRRATR